MKKKWIIIGLIVVLFGLGVGYKVYTGYDGSGPQTIELGPGER